MKKSFWTIAVALVAFVVFGPRTASAQSAISGLVTDTSGAVLPGVTGLAQVQLPPDSCLDSVRRKLRYDRYYADHYSPWLDLRLILTTAVKAVGLLGVVRSVLRIPGPRVVEPERAGPTAETAEMPFVVESKG